MLTQEFRTKLMKHIKENPKKAMKEIEENPKILEILLNNEQQMQNEKVKYINMTRDMDRRLQEEAKKLKTTQGLLIGAGLLLLLTLLD